MSVSAEEIQTAVGKYFDKIEMERVDKASLRDSMSMAQEIVVQYDWRLDPAHVAPFVKECAQSRGFNVG